MTPSNMEATAGESLVSSVNPTPSPMPTAPPSSETTIDSPKTMPITRRRRQPIARSTPISRVRSKTLIRVLFIMPRPPTSTAKMPIKRPNERYMPNISVCVDGSPERVAASRGQRSSISALIASMRVLSSTRRLK